MYKKYVLAIGTLFTSFIATAQQVRPATAGNIYHEIARLRHLTSVLYVAAHPDDENTRLLAYLVNDQHIRTAYLSLTRGDGGQNLLGSEQSEALGLIRTHELIEARKMDGAEQFFTRAIDFGFSKNHEETFRHWPKEQLTEDAVLAIRRLRPDVVICRFPPDSMAGHGQHAASAFIADMSYKAAGDKSQFKQQIDRFPAWQPKRLLLNTYRFGTRNTTSEDQFKLAVGQYVPAMGMGVGELAGHSRSIHKSQGAGTPSVPGVQTEYFKLVAGDSFKVSMFDGIDITWGRVGRKDIGDDLQKILDNFNTLKPDASIPALIAVRKKINGVKDSYWRAQKLNEIDEAILHCAGIMAEYHTRQPEAVKGEELPFTLRVIARSSVPVTLKSIDWGGNDSATNLRLSYDSLLTIEHKQTIPASTPITQPYWLERSSGNPYLYYMPTDASAGLPQTPTSLQATLMLSIAGEQFSMKVPYSYKKLDPVKGDVVEQLRIVPDAAIAFSNDVMIARADGSAAAAVRIHAYKEMSGGYLSIVSDQATKPVYELQGLNLRKGTDTLITFNIAAGNGKDYSIVPMLSVPNAGALHLIQYPHLPALQYFTTPKAKVLQPTWKYTAKRIGYVEGAGDNIPTLLRLAGMEVDILKDADFADVANLSKYYAIMTGIRVVNAEKRMAYWMPMLLQYAQNGGTLVVQHNTLNDMATSQLGPYPLKLSNKRVTEEDAAVTLTAPTHKLLTYPNKIDNTDFEGWVQERALNFPTEWDDRYATLLSMNDSGEPALTSGILYAATGKGHYVYTSLAFSRQLPVGNKGAVRLLLNMLSVGK